MPNDMTQLTDLQLTLQRLVDADSLLEEEAAPLLAEIEAALQSTEGAALEAVCRLADRVGHLAVIRTLYPEPADSRDAPAAGTDSAR